MEHTMKDTAARAQTGTAVPMWVLAFGTVVFGAGALYILVQNPAALPIAAVAAALAIVARVGYGKVRTMSRERAETSGAVANVGLVIAGVAIAPLILFALLWTSLLLIIGAAWVLHIFGLA
jgi:hypothetical protein